MGRPLKSMIPAIPHMENIVPIVGPNASDASVKNHRPALLGRRAIFDMSAGEFMIISQVRSLFQIVVNTFSEWKDILSCDFNIRKE